MVGGIAINEICQLERLEEVYKDNVINVISTDVLTTWNCLQVWSDIFKQEMELWSIEDEGYSNDLFTYHNLEMVYVC